MSTPSKDLMEWLPRASGDRPPLQMDLLEQA